MTDVKRLCQLYAVNRVVGKEVIQECPCQRQVCDGWIYQRRYKVMLKRDSERVTTGVRFLSTLPQSKGIKETFHFLVCFQEQRTDKQWLQRITCHYYYEVITVKSSCSSVITVKSSCYYYYEVITVKLWSLQASQTGKQSDGHKQNNLLLNSFVDIHPRYVYILMTDTLIRNVYIYVVFTWS